MSEIENNANKRMSENKNGPSKSVYITLAILGILIILYSVIVGVMRVHGPPRPPDHLLCGSNLALLGKAMLIYTEDFNGLYPTADKWCDLLVSFSRVEPNQFICRSSDAKVGESSYALNKNIAGKKYSEVPPDTVLLFETKVGWNQVGGPELLTLENHKGEGCNVVFGDWHVEYVKAERIGELKWDTEKQSSKSIE